MKWSFILIAFLINLVGFSQNVEKPVVLYGAVTTTDGYPLNSAHVRDLTEGGNTSITDKEGNFSLIVDSLPANLEITYVGYKNKLVSVSKKKLEKGTNKIRLSVVMELDSVALPTIPVRPEEKVETVFDPYRAYLFDYIFMDGQLLLLVSESGQRRLQLLDENHNTILKQNISHTVFEFEEDCMGYYHLLGEDSAYQVILEDNQFTLFANTSRSALEEALKPCVSCKGEICIVQGYKDHNQTKVIYKTNRQGNPIDSIYGITNKVTKNYTVSTYNEILAQLCIDPMDIEGELDLSKINVPRQLEQEIWFYQKILTKPVFCPILPVNNHFYIFDHVNNELVAFDIAGNLTHQTKSSYNKKRAGLKEILVNGSETKAFALFIKSGRAQLDEINLETGDSESSYVLAEHYFPEKIGVKDDYVYYLFKEAGFENKFRLYRQRLR